MLHSSYVCINVWVRTSDGIHGLSGYHVAYKTQFCLKNMVANSRYCTIIHSYNCNSVLVCTVEYILSATRYKIWFQKCKWNTCFTLRQSVHEGSCCMCFCGVDNEVIYSYVAKLWYHSIYAAAQWVDRYYISPVYTSTKTGFKAHPLGGLQKAVSKAH